MKQPLRFILTAITLIAVFFLQDQLVLELGFWEGGYIGE
jgi:hypothetical protein